MATYYVDLENGNDANDGLSFANRKKTLQSAVNLATSSGDNIRVMASPDATSLGQNANWTSTKWHSSMDMVFGGSTVINSSTNTTPITITTLGNHNLNTGDFVKITSHSVNTNANGFWRITKVDATSFSLDDSSGNGVGAQTGSLYLSSGIQLTTPVTKNIAGIDNTRTAWTANTNVTTSITATNTLAGPISKLDTIAPAAAFTTGKMAYKTLPSALDLSGYQQICFIIKQNSGTFSDQYSLSLCSDTSGNTVVNNFQIPNLVSTAGYRYVTIDYGSALGSNINSVALYRSSNLGAANFSICGIIACKAPSANDSLTYNSLISPENDLTKPWYGIKFISEKYIVLKADHDANATPAEARYVGRYYGLTGSQPVYKREPIKYFYAASTMLATLTSSNTGTSTNKFTISGGWDRTNMSTKNSRTFLNFGGGAYTIVNSTQTSHGYVSITDFVAFNTSQYVISTTGVFTSLSTDNMGFIACSSYAIYTLVSQNILNSDYFIQAYTGSYYLSPSEITASIGYLVGANTSGGVWGQSGSPLTITNINVISQSQQGLGNITNGIVKNIGLIEFCNYAIGSCSCVEIENIDYINVCNYIFPTGAVYLTIRGAEITNTYTALSPTFTSHNVLMDNCSIDKNSFPSYTTVMALDKMIRQSRLGGNINSNRVWIGPGYYESQTSVRHTASGIAWAATTKYQKSSEAWPIRIPIAKIACSANNLVTVKVWVQRSNVDYCFARLFCPKNQLDGLTSNMISYASASANTWEELTISFTPTQAGVVDVFVDVYGLFNNASSVDTWAYIDDLTITQA